MFLTPFFLIAAGVGAAIPLILHMMQNQRKVTLPFPTLRFLLLAQKQSSRRIRMENFLLWLIRTLIMAAIGIAFAMPMIRSSGLGWLGSAPRDVAIILDASYSMGYNTGHGTVWEKGVQAASAIIEGLTDNDRYCIFLARDESVPLIAELIGNKQEGLNRLKTVKLGNTSSRLDFAVDASLKTLRKAQGRREREIHIITDNQALPWLNFVSQDAAAAPSTSDKVATVVNPVEIDKKTAVFVALLGVPKPENSWVSSIDVDPPEIHKGSDAKVIATIKHMGPPGDSAVTIFIDGKEVARRAIKADDPLSFTPSFSLPPLTPGVHVARVETPDDNLPLDNAFHFLLRVKDRLPSLIVGSQEDTLFVRTALNVSFGRESGGTTITPDQITSKRLEGNACTYLCDALPLSGQAITALEDYVRKGGVLVLFPGIKASMQSYQSWTCLPGIPTGIEEVHSNQNTRNITWDKPQHPLIRPLGGSIAVPTMTLRRRLIWDKLDKTAVRIASMGANQPFLLERPFGSGSVLMFAVSADRTWSDFPLSPFYLPLVSQCAEYGAGFGAKAPFLWAANELPLSEQFPELKGIPTIIGPDGKAVSVRSAVTPGKPVLSVENITMPGIYAMATEEQPEPKPAFAINFPKEESDLTPIPDTEIVKRLNVDHAFLATDIDSLRKMIEEHRVGRTYGEHLLWVALFLIAVEFLYANALMRGSQRMTNQIGVDLAGHVKSRIVPPITLPPKS